MDCLQSGGGQVNRWYPATLLPILKTFYIYVHPSGARPILRVQNGMLNERIKQTELHWVTSSIPVSSWLSSSR